MYNGMDQVASTPQQVRLELEQTQSKADTLRAQLEGMERACSHQWSAVQQVSEPYTSFENDMSRPVHKGSDFWYETRAVERYRKAWVRHCTVCGKKERTTNTNKSTQVVETPAF